MWRLHGVGELKFVHWLGVPWPNWSPYTYMVILWKSSSQELNGRWPWNLVCSIRDSDPTKFVQMMNLSWPWPILRQIRSLRLLCRKKSQTVDFFLFCCSLWHQSWYMQSAKWTFINTKSQGHLLTFILVASNLILLTSSPLKLLGWFKSNYMWGLYGMGERKFVHGIWGTWPRWPPCAFIVKPFDLLLRNWTSNDLELAMHYWGL